MKLDQIKNRSAYESLTEANIHWGRQDKNHIWVYTEGYKTMGHYQIEEFLMRAANMRMLSEVFDRVCGQTKAIYKHK